MTTRTLTANNQPLTALDGTVMPDVDITIMLVPSMAMLADGGLVTGLARSKTDSAGVPPDIELTPNDIMLVADGEPAPHYVVHVHHSRAIDFAGQMPSGSGPFTWAQFRSLATPLTAAQINALATHLADYNNPHHVAADGVTITGDGTAANPFSAITGGSGNVSGPASATNLHVALFDGPSGKLLKDSGLFLGGSNTGDQVGDGTTITGAGTVMDPFVAVGGGGGGDMYKTDNLSGLANTATARANIGLGNVNNTSDANKPVSTAQAAADAVVLSTAKSYADTIVVGLIDDRGNYNASVNAYPSSGGSGASGAILKGDLWTVSVGGTLPAGLVVTPGDLVRALVDSPGSTQANWAITENNIGFVPENVANKSTSVVTDQASNTKYPSVKAIYDWAVGLFQIILVSGTNIKTINGSSLLGSGDLVVGGGGGGGTWGSITGTLSSQTDLNSALAAKAAKVTITDATKTKVTYNADGIVTAGADATTADIADSTNKRYVTDAGLAVLGNTSGTNTGDQDLTTYALKTYVDTAVTGLWDMKGATDASTSPNYPVALKGDAYVISVAGKIGGASGTAVDIGDIYVALADNAGGTEASVGSSWAHIEHNLAGALLATNNLSDITSASTARSNLGLGTLATQNGTFSGTSSGTNTGDQSSVSGNAGTATALETARTIDGQSFNGTANITVIAPATHGATSKATPVDADEITLVDSAASFVLKKLTWANLKAAILGTVNTWTKAQTGAVTTLSIAANAVAVDLSLSNNFSLALQATTSQVLSNPTNAVAGTSGQIAFTQNATPSTLTFGANWIYAHGASNPAVSTTAGTVNLMSYYVVDSTHIWFTLANHGVA